MFADCQDAYQHAVLPSEDPATNAGDRVGVVFKKAIPAPGSGRLGHGLPKQKRTTRVAAPEAKRPPAAAPRRRRRKPTKARA